MVHYPSIYPANSAVFIPAISSAYTSAYAGFLRNPGCTLPPRLTITDLNFLMSTSALYSVGIGLYSAGPSLGSEARSKRLDMVTDRVGHDAEIIADSGGFQVAQGHIVPVSPGKKPPKGKTPWKGQFNLTNLESFAGNCDWSPVLDFPLAMLVLPEDSDQKYIDQYVERLRANGGVDPLVLIPGTPHLTLDQLCAMNNLGPKFNTCLWYTLHNTDFLTRQPDSAMAKKLWAVYQGRCIDEARVWSAAMRRYRLPGICFAGNFLVRGEQTIERVVEDISLGFYDYVHRLHFLGTGELQNICSYSTLQSCLRSETGNERLLITADAASPFVMFAKGSIPVGFRLGTVDWTFSSSRFADLVGMPADRLLEDALYEIWRAKVFKGGVRAPDPVVCDRTIQVAQHFFVRSEIAKKITVGHLGLKADGKAASHGNLFLMNHSLQVYMEGMVVALGHYHAETPTMVPPQLLVHKRAIQTVFDARPQDRMAVLQELGDELNILAGLTNAPTKRVRYHDPFPPW
ncbi:MAG: hypothetical protein WCJ64_01435 [Rhodospirillaceae bacterium]